MGGFDTSRFKQSDLKEQYFCSICSDVFKDPVQRVKCQHYFCRECITEWLKTSKSCPIDRQPLTSKSLTDAPRFMKDTLADLDIGCDFASAGCQIVVKLERLESHVKECLFSPEVIVNCVKGCGASFKLKDEGAHCCLSYLKKVVNELEEEMKKEKKERKKEQKESKDREQKLKDEVKALNEKEKEYQRFIKMLRLNVKRLEEKIEEVPSQGQSSAQIQKTGVLHSSSGSCLTQPEVTPDQTVVHTMSRPRLFFFSGHRCYATSLVINYNGFKLNYVPPYRSNKFRFNISIPLSEMTRVVVMLHGIVSLIRVHICDMAKEHIKSSLGLTEATLSTNHVVIEVTNFKEEAKRFTRSLLSSCPSLQFAEVSISEFNQPI